MADYCLMGIRSITLVHLPIVPVVLDRRRWKKRSLRGVGKAHLVRDSVHS